MTPSEKRSLRLSWYGLSLSWPLSNDVNGQPYFLARNDNGRHILPSAAGLNKGAEDHVQPARQQS
jgi:hypothetical protein